MTMAKALEEDPTVYQYDEVYDAMEDSKRSVAASKKVTERKVSFSRPNRWHSLTLIA